MRYSVELSEQALKELKRIDKSQQRLIVSWVQKNLQDCENPRLHGKSLTGNYKGYWRYRIGSYRIIAEINDNKISVLVISVGHRKDVYK